MTGICNWKEAISRLGPPNSTQKNNSPKIPSLYSFLPTWRSSPCHSPLHYSITCGPRGSPYPWSLFSIYSSNPAERNLGGPPSSINPTIYKTSTYLFALPFPLLHTINQLPVHSTWREQTHSSSTRQSRIVVVRACLSQLPFHLYGVGVWDQLLAQKALKWKTVSRRVGQQPRRLSFSFFPSSPLLLFLERNPSSGNSRWSLA